MNSLSDILSQKADAIFPPDSPAVPAMPDSASSIRQLVHHIQNDLAALLRLIDDPGAASPDIVAADTLISGERIVEGAFTGEKMLGNDGKEYAVPANYASKSKLVAGDRMKLTITKSGSFIYKQIGPVERKRLIGALAHDMALDAWSVSSEGRAYRVLTASVTFHKGASGDEAIILVPRDAESLWGAVENIIHT